MLKFFSAGGVVVLAFMQSSGAYATPRFEDYPSTVQTVSKQPGLKLVDSASRLYATQLTEASRKPIDFAGRYAFAEWGCGAACVMAAAIDKKTGAVFMLPFTVSNWPLDVIEPIAYRKNSALLIVRGSRDERGKGTYYYRFDGHAFRLLCRDETAGDN